MRKPVNKLAVALWFVAALVAFLNAVEILSELRSMANRADDPSVVIDNLVGVLAGALVPVMQLVAFGGLIELLDQIRWDARNRR